ncbi:MAG: DNA repair protein RecO [Betaproteobacteria bacterium RIFCSPLOWO2_02_FULL_67_26]|nr:MAG: DNA repair protein RecO [Betaproteobacteria bacterium RIFCSPLOWO2_02_FULL_67_26]
MNSAPAFVLHTYPFRETSLIIEAFSRDHGRVALVARGARRPRSALRGALLPFQPLLLSWSGKRELRTLTRAEWQGNPAALKGQALICGFYLNELLLKLTPRDDPHEHLFSVYEGTLAALAGGVDQAAVLRRFEMDLLRELGYAVILDRDVGCDQPVAREHRYVYVVERGPVSAGVAPGNGVELSGQTLIDMQSGIFTNPATQQQSKALMRTLINHYLGSQVLHTRQLLRDLQDL